MLKKARAFSNALASTTIPGTSQFRPVAAVLCHQKIFSQGLTPVLQRK